MNLKDPYYYHYGSVAMGVAKSGTRHHDFFIFDKQQYNAENSNIKEKQNANLLRKAT